jgi:TM2 domain-containing membrane protein YozV
MNCAYHNQNVAVVNCNGCGKALCPACDHRIKGFPFCQDCIVAGVELLRHHNQSSYVPFVKAQTSPLVATLLSFVCPGLGAAYNGQTGKALIHFAVTIGLFQMAILTGVAVFAFGVLGMWLYAAVDAWKTAKLIRSGVTPDGAEDILVQRFSGNPKLWGIVLTVLGSLFFLQAFFNIRGLMKGLLPVLLIGLGLYLIRDYVFKSKTDEQKNTNFDNRGTGAPNFVSALNEPQYNRDNYDTQSDYPTQTRVRSWKNR